MNRLLVLALLVSITVAFLSTRHRRVKFEVEFEIEPRDEKEDIS